MGISLVLIYTDIILPETPSYANIIVILVLVIVSTLLDFIEEYRSNRAAEKLKELVATSTTVIRDKKEIQMPISQVVLGDVISLSAGSMMPADLRIIEGKDLYVGQSSLTGESDWDPRRNSGCKAGQHPDTPVSKQGSVSGCSHRNEN